MDAENMAIEPVDAKELRAATKKLVETVEQSYFDLGGYLAQIVRSGAFRAWGFSSFKDYLEQELGFKQRKGYYLISLYEKATIWGIDRTRLEALGWSKSVAALDAANNMLEAIEWLTRAEKMSLSQLLAAIRLAKEKVSGATPEPITATETGVVDVVLPVLRTFMDAEGNTFSVVEIALAPEQYEAVRDALEIAAVMNRKADTTRGNLLHLVSLDFMEHNGAIENIEGKISDWVNRNVLAIVDDETAEV